MSTNRSNRSGTGGSKSLFFQDLASPVSTQRGGGGGGGGGGGKFTSPGQAAAVSALWRENFGGNDLPPPPMFTLEDRVEFSPEHGVNEYPFAEVKTPTPAHVREFRRDSVTPVSMKSRFEASSGGGGVGGQTVEKSGSSSWWSPGGGAGVGGRSGGGSGSVEKEKGSPVEGVVKTGALITLPPPREVARPEVQRNGTVEVGNVEEEEWVTVYGFSPSDTNLVLREFEKCGTILKHISGPRNANWMHILYQNRFDAQKAYRKNGMQINGVLIVGVKPVDPIQRQVLNDGYNNNIQGFMTLPPPSTRSAELIPSSAPIRPYYLANGNYTAQRSASVVASPAKSVVSKIVDLMFGI